MTTEELQQIKDAAVRIHSAAVAKGKWEPRPEWESKLMDIVCDIARAVEAEKWHRRASMKVFEDRRKSNYDDFNYAYMCGIDGTMEDYLADAVIDILDTVEGFGPDWTEEEHLRTRIDHIRHEAGKVVRNRSFEVWCYDLLSNFLLCHLSFVEKLLSMAVAMGDYCKAHGIDLRRHVELKIKYNETGR